ncbi:NAD(P)-binding protein [Ophiobolus disseminans]|uniref:NAD(P)-binding protein n=1 Tax=Ophiobolus disseminans TaxID=1469910 RepID=A0A6A7A330_9PLEO|nr:NAD(P)-binding protein [Ophiobolus disseminans]
MSDSNYTSTVLITGGTQGLGYHCALSLARSLPPTTLIVLASRTDPSASAASINTQLKQDNVVYLSLDLGTLDSVRTFASTWPTSYPPISALILNAGIQLLGPLSHTADGIEKHFGINHVAHALLFHLLVPHLSSDARIIVVTSGLHDPEQGKKWGLLTRYTTAAAAAYPTGQDLKWTGRERYATSKAANCIWAFALSRHIASIPQHSAKTVLAFDPGLMFGTNFARDASRVLKVLNAYVLPRLTPLLRVLVNGNINTPAESGGNMAWLVTAAELAGKKGVYFEKRGKREASVQARDEGCQEELWGWTVGKVAGDAEERQRFGRVG